MRRLLLIPLSFLFLQSFGQFSNSGEYIAVIGKASGSYVPDMVTFDFTINVTDKKQQNAIQKLNEQSEKTIHILSALGYDSKQIKLSDYNLGEDIDYFGEKPRKTVIKLQLTLNSK